MLPRNTSGLPGLFGELVRLEIELWDAVEARLTAEHDLTLARFLAMQVIARRPGCRVQDIAVDLAITVGGTSKVVDRIVAAGHCTRAPNPGDRRSSLITLTPAGQRLLRHAGDTFAGELDRRIGGVLAGDDLTAFVTTLGALRAAVARGEAPVTRGETR